MILIDAAMVLRGLFVALTPWCLQILEGWQVGRGTQPPHGSLVIQSSKSPEGLRVTQSLFAVGKRRQVASQAEDPAVPVPDPRGHFRSACLRTAGCRLTVSPPLSSP